jgi:hypothetical protein
MTSLQIGLIVAGVVLVAAVLLYNWLQERRVRRRIDSAFAPRSPGSDVLLDDAARAAVRSGRVEPTLREDAAAAAAVAAPLPENRPAGMPAVAAEAERFEPPVDIVRRASVETGGEPAVTPLATPVPAAADSRAGAGLPDDAAPDPEIESIVILQPVQPVPAGALAAGLHARLGKPLRWFGRRGASDSWQRLRSDTGGEFTEIAACLLLADRTGAARAPLLDAFVRLAGEVASSLPGAFVAPNPRAEAERAEALDRICADLDVQIGVTLLKSGPAMIPGTRLRGVAEAAGFRLASGGRFEWVHEDTGATLFTLQNYRSEPFTVDSLRLMSTPGAVLLLDVPRIADPARVFDQMKQVAKRMAQSLDAALVDDNRRVLDDAALAAIRQQVQATATTLGDMHIAPGGSRALALFGG